VGNSLVFYNTWLFKKIFSISSYRKEMFLSPGLFDRQAAPLYITLNTDFNKRKKIYA